MLDRRRLVSVVFLQGQHVFKTTNVTIQLNPKLETTNDIIFRAEPGTLNRKLETNSPVGIFDLFELILSQNLHHIVFIVSPNRDTVLADLYVSSRVRIDLFHVNDERPVNPQKLFPRKTFFQVTDL